MTNKRVLSVFTLNCLQTGHRVRVDYYIVMNWSHVSVIVQSHWWLWPELQRRCCCLAVFWTVSGRLSHHPGNGGWWLLLPPLSHPFWNHQCKLHHVILVLHDTHWIELGLLVWRSYICSLLQWGRFFWDRNRASLCVNHLLFRAITRDLFKLGSLNLDQRCKRPWLTLKSIPFWSYIKAYPGPFRPGDMHDLSSSLWVILC